MKNVIETLKQDNVQRIYICGPTVYDDVHIGNLRLTILFDVYQRVLNALSIPYVFVSNITDIDDKIIFKAKELNIDESEVAEKYTLKYQSVLESLNVIKPDIMPSVIANIEGIVEFVKRLVAENKAYESNGNVFFSIDSYDQYGSVSKRKLEDLIDEAETSPGKRNPKDFALWKKTNVGVTWDSPWGKGRPGWHTECAYFIDHYFMGHELDIHGGGLDLIFPHHENENAQFGALNATPIAKRWIHNAMVLLNGKKMSKSQGNILKVENFVNTHGVNTLKLLTYNTPITNELNVSDQTIGEAKSLMTKIENLIKKSKLLNIEINKDLADNGFVKQCLDKVVPSLKVNMIIDLLNGQIKEINKALTISKEELDSFKPSKELITKLGNFAYVIELLNLRIENV